MRIGRNLSFALGSSAFGAVLLGGSEARAFCRTVTQAPPPDFNQQAQGCFTGSPERGAKELFWRNACVGYSLQKSASNQVTLEQARQVVSDAFATWISANCDGGHPTVALVDQGPVDCSEVRYNQDQPNQHVIVFRDDDWPHSDPNNTLGLTTLRFDIDTGEIYDADMEINSQGNRIVVGGAVVAGSFDLASIITHEAGHFLGLAHSDDAGAVMFAHYHPASPYLTDDDNAGICSIYAADGTRVTSNGAVAADACDPTPRHGFASTCTSPGAVGTAEKAGCSAANAGAPSSPGSVAVGLIGLVLAALRRARPAKRPRHWPAATLLPTFLSIVVAFALGLAATRAEASVSIAILFDELVRDASAAAIVTPVEQLSVWEDGRIFTYTRVHVDTAVAGQLPDDPWVRTMGGAVGNIGELVDGEPVLVVGHPSLLFLQPQLDHATKTPTGSFEVTARGQGQFPVSVDERKMLRLVRAHGVGALVPPPDERVEKVARQRGVSGAPKLAREALHLRLVDEATSEIAAVWSQLHAK